MVLRGEYGRLPGTPDPEVMKKALGDEEVITCRPADLIENELDKEREKYAGVASTEDDLLSCIMFPQVAPDFLKRRDAAPEEKSTVSSDTNDVREIEVDWL